MQKPYSKAYFCHFHVLFHFFALEIASKPPVITRELLLPLYGASSFWIEGRFHSGPFSFESPMTPLRVLDVLIVPLFFLPRTLDSGTPAAFEL